MEGARRLSKQQKSILLWLLRAVRILEDRNDATARITRRTGIPWRPQVADKDRESCRRSALCRAIERLEHRGLIQRVYGRKGRRTIALTLTRAGRLVAEALTVNKEGQTPM